MNIKLTLDLNGRRVFAVGENGETTNKWTAFDRIVRAYEAAKKA